MLFVNNSLYHVITDALVMVNVSPYPLCVTVLSIAAVVTYCHIMMMRRTVRHTVGNHGTSIKHGNADPMMHGLRLFPLLLYLW